MHKILLYSIKSHHISPHGPHKCYESNIAHPRSSLPSFNDPSEHGFFNSVWYYKSRPNHDSVFQQKRDAIQQSTSWWFTSSPELLNMTHQLTCVISSFSNSQPLRSPPRCCGILIKTLANASQDQRFLSATQIILNVLGFGFTFVTTVMITIYAKRRLKQLQRDEELLLQ